MFSTRARSSSDVGERVILGSGESGLGAGASKNSLLVHFYRFLLLTEERAPVCELCVHMSLSVRVNRK